MQFDPATLRTGFDWSFRPKTYFLPGAAPPPGPLPDAVRAAIARLMENADPDSSAHGGLALGAVQMNVIDDGSDPREMHGFATVTSRFYPELGAWFARLVDAWLDAQVAECAEDADEKGGANEDAR